MNDSPSWMNNPQLSGVSDPIRSGPPHVGDGEYTPCKACSPGAVLSFEIVRARPEQDRGCEIPYFQPIVPHFLGDSLLALCCPAIALTVFIEGRNLTRLRAMLRARRIEALYEWDGKAPLADPNDAVITVMRVELSSDVSAIERWPQQRPALPE